MTLAGGLRLGPYEILAAIGAGGMGEVYKARDTRLDRTVAIKILPASLAADPQFRDRFDREARTISQLDHPHICALYDVGEQDGTSFLVMQYLEGETLEARLKKGALPLDQALQYAIQIADALATAHKAGIVHRDLKPGNVMLTKSGAKLLDFGLAKTGAPVMGGVGLSMLPTTPPITQQGSILGTFQYMAPEQLEGQDADRRTDIFAFGAVLYEVLTGKRAFEGNSPASLIGAILRAEPAPIPSLQPLVPDALDHVVTRCLAKTRDGRWQSMIDVTSELKWIADTSARTRVPALDASVPRSSRRSMWVAWSLAGLATSAAVAMVATLLLRRAPVDTHVYRSTWVSNPDLAGSAGSRLALSPDGTSLAFVSRDATGRVSLSVRLLDSLTARPLPGTDDASGPFWSPDSRSLAFFSQGKLKRIDASGGPVIPICDCASVVENNWPGTWSRDDVILFSCPFGPILRVPATGGTPAAVTFLDTKGGEFTHGLPSILPDGRHFVYSASSDGPAPAGVYIGSIDSADRIRVLEREQARSARYAQGRVLFPRATTLFAQAFDAQHLAVLGEPVPIAEQVQMDPVPYLPGVGAFTVSETGVLAYEAAGISTASRLVWVDRGGKRLSVVGIPLPYSTINLSPDGSQAALLVTEAGRVSDLWIMDVRTGRRNRVTFDPGGGGNGIWSPEGTRIAYDSMRNGQQGYYQKASTGVGTESLLYANRIGGTLVSWSRDGRFLLYETVATATSADLWVLPLTGNRQPYPFVRTAAIEDHGQFSPDGQWVAYTSTEEGRGRNEVFVVPFPGPGGKWQVSTTGGDWPRWRRDGKELFFITKDKLTAASVITEGGRVEVGAVTALFDLPGPHSVDGWDYDVSPDGQQFLVIAKDQAAPAPINLVVNWTAALKK